MLPVENHLIESLPRKDRQGLLKAGDEVELLRALVQGAGAARRIGVETFSSLLALSTPLQRVMHRYLYVLMDQLTTSTACQRYHPIGQRLARWLLMSRDRAHTDSFYVTQEFLALMLGVRRVGVTEAASALQRDGLIEYRRGRMTVLDRSGLEDAACSCYRTDRKSYAALL